MEFLGVVLVTPPPLGESRGVNIFLSVRGDLYINGYPNWYAGFTGLIT